MKPNIFLLIIINIINYCYLKNSEIVELTIYENTFIKDVYNITLLNIKEAKIESKKSKLAYITNINIEDSVIYNYFSKYFNRIWIFYISDLEQIKQVLSKDFEDYDIIITGILIPKGLEYKITSNNNRNENIPIFEIDEELNEIIEQYDIRKNNRNSFFLISAPDNLIIPIKYVLVFSILALLSSVIISLSWNIFEKRVGPNYIFNLHDKIKYIFCAQLFLSLTLIFIAVSLMRKDNYELNATVEISLSLSCSFFKSILWFFIYLISFGWYICFQDLEINEQKKLVRLLIFIIICFWIDDILEKYSSGIWIFHLSEIKNILLYGFLSFFSIKNINKNIDILKRKYNYALLLLPEYTEGILAKIRLLSKLRIMIISYLPIFFIILIIQKLFLEEYDSSLLLIYDYLIPDFILEFIFVFLMRPKIVPDFYNVDLGDIFNEIEGTTYKCSLSKFDERFEDNRSFKSHKKYLDEETPIIIIGPNHENLNSINSDKSEIIENDINKYFSNIQIGYYNK